MNQRFYGDNPHVFRGHLAAEPVEEVRKIIVSAKSVGA